MIQRDRLMCKYHWFLIPRYMRSRIWRYWDNGRGVWTKAYAEWVEKAIDFVAQKERVA